MCRSRRRHHVTHAEHQQKLPVVIVVLDADAPHPKNHILTHCVGNVSSTLISVLVSIHYSDEYAYSIPHPYTTLVP